MQRLKNNGKLYYGWYIAAALAITETISWGIVCYAFTVFITPMETELGWSRSQLTGGFSLALLIAGAMAFPIGTWIDRHGARWLMYDRFGSYQPVLLLVVVLALPAAGLIVLSKPEKRSPVEPTVRPTFTTTV